MITSNRIRVRIGTILILGILGFGPAPTWAQPAPAREFPIGRLQRITDLPTGRFRADLEQLPAPAQERARAWLRSFHFTAEDLPSLHTDAAGGICYACEFSRPTPTDPVAPEPTSPEIGAAAVPISPFPAHLVFHSRPGSANVLYLEFSGTNVSNTQWNTVVGRSEIPARPFSTDSDFTTFSDAEQLAIKRIWQRMAEDFAAFDIDVTTERPANFNNRTAIALITRNTDANGAANPYNSAGGVAYVNVFNTTQFAQNRPAWIYHDNLGNVESYIAEAASHEIGHNLGLSHDGTSSSSYYGGHGSGEISWGPLMGTGYNQNVSQWSKGEYYLANNTQDDLATIAGKLSYRSDDHGSTPGTATALTLSNGTNIVSTTPETDAANINPVNKGVLATSTDVDVFSFVTGSGAVRLAVSPWIMPAGTRGGNVDLLIELYNDAGVRLATNNPATQTTALIQTNLSEGRYYLHVRNSGAGTPLVASPSGYTAYGSLGQYFINGYVTASSGYVVPPVAELLVTDLTQAEQSTKQFSVTYSDDVAIAAASLDSNDIQVTGPNGYAQLAQFVSVNTSGNGSPRTATYAITPPGGGSWSPAHNGTYQIFMRSNQVSDTEGMPVAAGLLGQFQVAVPMAIYVANFDADPGWTLEPQWQYGVPAYTGGGPTSGATGSKIIAYNLSGAYANNLSVKYATTPAIDTSGNSALTVRFMRWLRTRASDTASLQVSTNGTTWLPVWSSSSTVSDTSWQAVQYPLPASVAGSSTLRLRWGLASNQNQNELGWNIDDVELLGDNALDSIPPVPHLNVADITQGGSPSHACNVTYTDGSAVRLATLDDADLLVTGPNGYSNLVTFVGADLPMDGSPLTGIYSLPAPGEQWEATDNGTYTITLLEDAVEDIFANATPQTTLGSFSVSISAASPGILDVSPAEGLTSSGPAGGTFSPASGIFTLNNTGGTALNWTVGTAENWITLSAAGGTLAAGGSTNITVSINANANTLPAANYSDLVAFLNTTSGNGNTTRPVNLTITPPANVALNVTVNDPTKGTVNLTNGTYAVGTTVELIAQPALFYRFNEWLGDASGTNNPLTLTLETNTTAQAIFTEVLTTNHPTPHAWLAAAGYTNDFETAAAVIGANSMPLWQSYIAGLNPNDPEAQLLIIGEFTPTPNAFVLNWATVTGRVYTIWSSPNGIENFTPLSGAMDLPATINRFTNTFETAPQRFYRLGVRKL